MSIRCFVEFKIYISLKLVDRVDRGFKRFVEFKIYISLKQEPRVEEAKYVL